MPDEGQTGSFGEYIEQQGRKRQNMEAKKFGQFIAGIRKEKKMTQAELAGKIHVTDKAISVGSGGWAFRIFRHWSRWRRHLESPFWN